MLVDLAQLKERLDLKDGKYDEFLTRTAAAVEQSISNFTGRLLKSTPVTEYFDGRTTALVLLHPPIISTETVSVYASSSLPRVWDSTTLVSSDYLDVDHEAGIIHYLAGSLGYGRRSVKVTATCGWTADTVPADVLRAIEELTHLAWSARKYIGISGATGPDGSVTRYDHDQWPHDVRQILELYRVRRLG